MTEHDYVLNTLKRIQDMVSNLPCADDDDISGMEIPDEYVEDYYKLQGIVAQLSMKKDVSKEKEKVSDLLSLSRRIDKLEKLVDKKEDLDNVEKELKEIKEKVNE